MVRINSRSSRAEVRKYTLWNIQEEKMVASTLMELRCDEVADQAMPIGDDTGQ